MSLSIYFRPVGMSSDKYDEVIKTLEKAGAGNPEGRIYHICFGNKKNLHVLDIWSTKESFDKFGQILMPILQKSGIDPGEPEITETHNIIEANMASH